MTRHPGILLGFAFILGQAVSVSAQAPSRPVPVLVTAANVPAGAVTDNGSSTMVSTANLDPREPVPVKRGWDASLQFTANHDSSSGWSNLVSPSLAYRFNSIFSADVSLPVYLTVNAYKVRGAPKDGKPPTPKSLHDELGDALFSMHAELHPGVVDYAASASISAPTGDTTYGLSSGRSAWNQNNHFEKAAGLFTPDVEVGIGNSAQLNNRRVKKNYTSLGMLANFQVGSSIDLPFRIGLDIEGYEQLPIGSQKVYTTVVRKKKHKQVLTGSGDAEDNGIDTSVDIALGRHLAANTFYSRSLRLGLDTAGLGLTYRFRAASELPH